MGKADAGGADAGVEHLPGACLESYEWVVDMGETYRERQRQTLKVHTFFVGDLSPLPATLMPAVPMTASLAPTISLKVQS